MVYAHVVCFLCNTVIDFVQRQKALVHSHTSMNAFKTLHVSIHFEAIVALSNHIYIIVHFCCATFVCAMHKEYMLIAQH